MIEATSEGTMKKIRVYNIVLESGLNHHLHDMILEMSPDFSYVDVFDEMEKILAENVDSYSYEELV
jgi:hypothetical protein